MTLVHWSLGLQVSEASSDMFRLLKPLTWTLFAAGMTWLGPPKYPKWGPSIVTYCDPGICVGTSRRGPRKTWSMKQKALYPASWVAWATTLSSSCCLVEPPMAKMEVSGKIGGTKKCLRKICTSYVSANQHLLDPDELLLIFSKCHLLVACDRHAKHLAGQQGIWNCRFGVREGHFGIIYIAL